MTTYKALAFSDDFDDGRISGTLHIEDHYLIFKGNETFWKIHKDDVIVNTGGTAGRQIFFKSKKNHYSLSTAELDIIKNPFFMGNVSTADKTASIIRRQNGNKLGIFGAVVLFALGLASLIYYRGELAHSIAEKMPYSVEQSLGESYIKEISATEGLDTTSSAVKELRSKMNLLLKQIDPKYAFNIYISPSEEVNAFALPGGHVVFNEGLLDEADSWEEVLGVGGHELAHVTEKHHTRGIVSKVGVFTMLSMLLGDGSTLTDLIFGAGAQLEGLTYSRNFETEADIKGFEYLTKSSINPAGLRTFFDKLNHIHGESENVATQLEFLSTHPSPDNRIEKLAALEKSKGSRNYLSLGDYRLFKQLLHPECSLEEL